MLIFLTGFMGAGKTHVGRQLAELLDCPFFDLDDGISSKVGKSISRIFEENGEPFFRQLEAEALRETENLANAVIATGGGAPCFHQNQDWMNEHGITIFLKASPALLAARLEKEAHTRPLLRGKTGAALQAFIGQTLATRAAFYEKSHLIYEIKGEEQPIAEELASYLKRFMDN